MTQKIFVSYKDKKITSKQGKEREKNKREIIKCVGKKGASAKNYAFYIKKKINKN